MVTAGLCFLAGILLFQRLPDLPPSWLAWVLLAVSLVCSSRWRWATFILVGFLWAWWNAHGLLSERLPQELSARDLIVTGVVDDLPQVRGSSRRFGFRVERAHLADDSEAVKWQGLVRLRWQGAQTSPGAGERWQLAVRLYPPSGFRNPGGMDYERWLYANRFSATGYVLLRGDHKRLPGVGFGVWYQALRGALRERFESVAPESDALALFKALVIGDRSGFEDGHWTVFRQTGTSHLVAISGLHLGLLAGLAFLVVGRLWRLSARLCLWMPAVQAAAVAAFVVALIYALLAGLSLPTQRALVMIAAGAAALVYRRNTSPPDVLVLALLAVLLLDPNAVLSPGFWLSFVAVAVIFLVLWGRLSRPGYLNALIRIQLAISLALVPVLSAWGLPVSPLGILVNLLAVPWFGFVVVPLSMLAAVIVAISPGMGVEVLNPVLWVLNQTWRFLEWSGENITWTWSPGHTGLIRILLASCGLLLLLLSVPWRLRIWGLVLLLPLVFPRAPVLERGAIRMAVLDVGQGLAVVLETAKHNLVYDLGPKYPSGFNTAETVVLPYLRSRGIPRVDKLVLSHDDVDHAGAWQQFIDRIPVDAVLSGQPKALGEGVVACTAGQRWQWDGVSFEVLHPESSGMHRNDNDHSCVIRIDTQEVSVLLTGDITRAMEGRLVSRYGERIAAKVVVVPHHGSRTSSSAALVDATGASLAMVSAGHGNRYGFPHHEVSQRWRQAGAELLETAASGAIILDSAPGGPLAIRRYREAARRYWHRR